MSETEQAKRFRAMADRIDHNGTDNFGGAMVVIPPTDGGEAIEMLIIDPHFSPGQFWGNLQTKCQIMISLLEQQERANQAFPRAR